MNMHRPDPEARRYAALIEENETLREEVRQLRNLLAPPLPIPHEWHLTQSEQRLLSALHAAGTRIITHERAAVAMCDRHSDLPELGIVRVLIVRVRRKLKLAGLPPVIETAWGIGYRLSSKGAAVINAALLAEARRLDALDAHLGGRGA